MPGLGDYAAARRQQPRCPFHKYTANACGLASCPRKRESRRRAPWGLDARFRGHDVLLAPDLRNGHLGIGRGPPDPGNRAGVSARCGIWDLLAGLGAGPAGRLRPSPGAAPPGLGRSRGHGADIGAAILSRPAGRGSGVRQRTRCLFHKSTASSPGFFWERHAPAWLRGRAEARRSQGESTGAGHTKWTSRLLMS